MEMTLIQALTVGATAVQAIGAISSANEEADMMEYNAAIAGQNAQLAQQNAQIALENAAREKQAAALEEARQREQVRRTIGAANAARGKSGISQAGSSLFVTEDSLIQGELDSLLIRHKGKVAANNYKSQAAQFRFQSSQYSSESSMLKAGARNTRTGGLLSAAGTVLTGAVAYKSLGSSTVKKTSIVTEKHNNNVWVS